MSKTAETLAAAWRDRANREAALPTFRAPHLFTAAEHERTRRDFDTAVAWYRYWTGIGAA